MGNRTMNEPNDQTTSKNPPKLITWLFSLSPTEQHESDPIKKLISSVRMTSLCRYNASIRIERLSKYSFFTTTFLSLGLIFIPLVQNSDVPLHFIPEVLVMMQIFLAVAVLVYSMIIGTARYDVRRLKLNECGDKLKDLIRELREINHNREQNQTSADFSLTKYHERYREILSESENHNRLDYLLSMLEKPNDYKITGLPRLYSKLKAIFFYIIPFILPSLMVLIEILFILDMLGICQVMPSYFGGDPFTHSKTAY